MSLIVRRYAVVAAAFATLTCQQSVALDQMEAGKKLFTQTAVPACATCHALAHANAKGQVGPDLDALKPDAARVEKAIRQGSGQMPPFSSLSDEQVQTLAQYVARAALERK